MNNSNLSCALNPQFDVHVEHLYAFQIERNFNWSSWHESYLCSHVHSYIYYVLGTYLMTIYALKKFMTHREAFDLRLPLTLWNATLATFSIFGAIRTLNELIAVSKAEGFDGTVCNVCYLHGVTGLWTFLFAFSKIPEMLDTVFIVLRKRPLIFLHWYHHLEACFYSIWTYSFPNIAVVRWLVTVNFCVHSLMYSYYCLSAAGIKLPRSVAMAITTAQTTQMFFGIFVLSRALILDCGNEPSILYGGIWTYSVYAVLFTNYFINSYYRRSNKVKKH